ncbi:hypothetical protein PCIT_a0217 [Pseudoalteromonas citrea]|uniref:Tat pathway signal protein n=2 Tax=Pseudoalteromonas citrea TaxID=43655 RepID=A0AAD4AKL7_9GAMM|nr:DUF1501 domain-containing protein [Pseudoalteromonas citrea]KAF7773879.1 hypothetical protein PCIT_a0217 [Pseudoalteromonas citrea]
MNRRSFLKAGSASVAAAPFLNLADALANTQINANGDYKALVCIFLYGGMDNHDTVIPYDLASYNKWSTIRSTLLSSYTTKRTIDNLAPITAPSRFGSRQFALAPELSGIAQLYQQGKVSLVGNVGPLLEPTSAAAIRAETAQLPSRLFSHNDQQSTWMSGKTEGAQFGWAGMLNDALIEQGIQSPSTFSAITTSDADLLITGSNTTPYHVNDGQAATINVIDFFDEPDALNAHFSALGHQTSNLLEQDVAAQTNRAYNANKQFNTAVSGTTVSLPSFPATPIAKQLETVSKTIAIREQLNEKRQIFVVTMGGFDTHSGQAQSLPKLQSALDGAFVAFDAAMQSLGLSDNVTLFTASDFGRTLAINGDGTDHGWGAHHFVMGGAVQGGTIFGDIPESELNHALDAGGGRLIPTLSVDQYAASLGQWLGIEQNTLEAIFPNLAKFGETPNLFK